MSQQPPYDPARPPYAQDNVQPAAQPFYTPAPQTPYPYAQPSSPRRFFRGRNLLIMGTILALVLGFLLYRQLTAGPASNWVGTTDTSSYHLAYYLYWDNQNNLLNGSLEEIGTDKIYSTITSFSIQFTGTYNSHDQTISLNLLSITSNGQTTSAPADYVETGKLNGNILTLYEPIIMHGVAYFHVGSADEYNQLKQQMYQKHASALIMLTAQAKATEQAYTNVTATAQAQVQATVSAISQTYTQATAGNPIYADSLAQNIANKCVEYADTGNIPCSFTNNSLDATLSASYQGECFLNESIPQGDFAFQIQAQVIKGKGVYLDFSITPNGNEFYGIKLSTNGVYDFWKYDPNNPSVAKKLQEDTNQRVAQGLLLGHISEITLINKGGKVFLYLNKEYIDAISDSISTRGTIGLSGGGPLSETMFSNLKIWSL